MRVSAPRPSRPLAPPTRGEQFGAALRITPGLLGTRRARHLVERNVYLYLRGWFFILGGVAEPIFYLASIGVGLSRLVGGIEVAGRLVAYPQYVAPGLLASAAMNGALVDTTFNFYYRLSFSKSYEAVLATPLSTGDVALGEIGWAVLRGSLYAATFLCVMGAFGDAGSWWAVCCLPAASLISAAFAAAGMAATSFVRSWQDLDSIFLATLPMFLFSGTFYPLSVYPRWLADVVRCTPLYQGVALERGFATGSLAWSLAGHAFYLGVLGVVGLAIISRRLARRLAP